MTTYKQSGVDIQAGYTVVEQAKKIAQTTYIPGVLGKIGAFSGFFNPPWENYKEPVLVSATDGAGTKVKIASATNIHNTIGIDLVAMNVNDILACGAKPLFFLDYIACQKINPKVTENILKGIAVGCKMAGCALIGGETAEMNDLYQKGEYDLAGFCVGIVEKTKIIDGRDIVPENIILGLASSGLHSNGFSLVRKVLFEKAKMKLTDKINGKTLGEIILEPTRIYVKPVLNILGKFNIKGIAHITGGGLQENVGRILPKDVNAAINQKNWVKPFIFSFIQKKGEISQEEMFNTFNMGIGMVILVDENETDKIISDLENAGEKVFKIGKIERGKGKVIII